MASPMKTKKRQRSSLCIETLIIVTTMMTLQGLILLSWNRNNGASSRSYYTMLFPLSSSSTTTTTSCEQHMLQSSLSDFTIDKPTTTTSQGDDDVTTVIAKVLASSSDTTVGTTTTATSWGDTVKQRIKAHPNGFIHEWVEPTIDFSPHDNNNNNNDKNNFGGIMARPFEPWPIENQPLPCYQPDENIFQLSVRRSPTQIGFLMVKGMKTGGSTAASINIRIATNVAKRYHSQQQQKQQYDICQLRMDHSTASSLKYHLRIPEKSFLWTIIRNPTDRAISQFFHFQVSRKKLEPTDENFKTWISKLPLIQYHYLRFLTTDPTSNHKSSDYDPISIANGIIQSYNFIGITERMEESAVVVQLLLGLTTSDILYLNSKNSGGFDDGGQGQCVYIIPSFISPGMQEYFNTDATWKQLTHVDTLFHQAINRSLDLTIEKLGTKRFHTALQQFRTAQRMVKERCYTNYTFPCTSDGQRNKDAKCIWEDSACGMDCLDDVSDTLKLYEATY